MQNDTVSQIHHSLAAMADGFNRGAQIGPDCTEYRHPPIHEGITGSILESLMLVPPSRQEDFAGLMASEVLGLMDSAQCCKASDEDVDAPCVIYGKESIVIPGIADIPLAVLTPVGAAGAYLSSLATNPRFTAEEKQKIIYAVGEFICSQYSNL